MWSPPWLGRGGCGLLSSNTSIIRSAQKPAALTSNWLHQSNSCPCHAISTLHLLRPAPREPCIALLARFSRCDLKIGVQSALTVGTLKSAALTYPGKQGGSRQRAPPRRRPPTHASTNDIIPPRPALCFPRRPTTTTTTPLRFISWRTTAAAAPTLPSLGSALCDQKTKHGAYRDPSSCIILILLSLFLLKSSPHGYRERGTAERHWKLIQRNPPNSLLPTFRLTSKQLVRPLAQ